MLVFSTWRSNNGFRDWYKLYFCTIHFFLAKDYIRIVAVSFIIFAIFWATAGNVFRNYIYRSLQRLEVLGNYFLADDFSSYPIELQTTNSNIAEFKKSEEILYKAFRLTHEKRAAECEMVEIAKQAAHDIRSPIMALRIALDGMPQVSPEQQQYIGAITSNVNEIAQELMDKYSALKRKVMLGAATLTEEAKQHMFGVAESDLIDANGDYVQYSIAKKTQEPISLAPVLPILEIVFKQKSSEFNRHNPKINFTLNISPEVAAEADKLCVKYNPSRLQRILSNLINNSVEAIDAAKRSDGAVGITLEKHADRLAITVSDNGCGMSPELIAKIFQNEQEHTANKENGNGIGLFSAIQTIKEWNGDYAIFQQSNVAGANASPGTGMQFVIYLPLVV